MIKPNHTEAYKAAYPHVTHRSAQSAAWTMMQKPHVKREYQRLMERKMKKHEITVDKILTDYQHALDLAKEQNQPANIVAAASAQAKLVGLLRERVETGQVGDFGDTTSIEGILDVVAKEAGPDAAMALAAMFGFKMPETEQSKALKEAALFIADPASDSVN